MDECYSSNGSESDSNSLDYVSGTDNDELSDRIFEVINRQQFKSKGGNNNKTKHGHTARSDKNLDPQPIACQSSANPITNGNPRQFQDSHGAKVKHDFVIQFAISC